MGPMSTAERQKRYRERALRDPDGTLLTRLQVMLSPAAATDLSWITMMTGQTRRLVVETALRELAKALRAEETEQRAFDRVGGSIKPGTKVPRCGE